MSIIAYALTIVLANWTLARYGLIDVGPWLVPAGTAWAAASLACRDWVHRRLGWRWAVAAILLGAALSWFVAPAFAAASGTAFLLSEALDLAVYAPLWRRRLWLAVALSGIVGGALDSWVFLRLAFGAVPAELFLGQFVVKSAVAVLVGATLWAWHRERRARLTTA